jgi:hypothetical protein
MGLVSTNMVTGWLGIYGGGAGNALGIDCLGGKEENVNRSEEANNQHSAKSQNRKSGYTN